MHKQLAAVVDTHFEFEHYVDDNMRNIPDHYHAHVLVLRSASQGARLQSSSGVVLSVSSGAPGIARP